MPKHTDDKKGKIDPTFHAEDTRPEDRRDDSHEPFGGLIIMASLPVIIGLILATIYLKGCNHLPESVKTPDPSRVWEEGIRQEKENAGHDPEVPEWIERQQQ